MPQLSAIGFAWPAPATTTRGIVLRNLPSLQVGDIDQNAFSSQADFEYLYVLSNSATLSQRHGACC
jgi:hypothetical protein